MSHMKPMNLEGDTAKNWITWRRKFERFRSTQDWKNDSPDVQAMKFIIAYGEKALDLCMQLNLTKQEMSDMVVLMEKFENHFIPRKNLTQHRHVLFNQKQTKDETTEEYIALLQRLAVGCKWGDQTNEILKMVFISGMHDDVCRARLLIEQDRSWEDTVSFSLLAEQINKACQDVTNKASVSKVEKVERKYCTYCGTKHEKAKCPAYKKVCGICKKPNHFTKMCRNKKCDGFVVI